MEEVIIKDEPHDKKIAAAPQLECNICFKKYLKKWYLNQHIKKEHDKICDICNACCKNEFQYIRHRYSHTGRFDCLECDFSTSKDNEITLHIKLTHAEQKGIQCDVCKRTLANVKQLKSHMQNIHSGKHVKVVDKVTLLCKQCNKIFDNLMGMEMHLKFMHEECSDSLRCVECNVKFETNTALLLHTHKNSVCTVCGENYYGNIDKHMLTHTPFVCGVCNKNFRSSSTLKAHQMIHTGKRPYPCNVCGKNFRYSIHLTTHQRVHTGERPFKCTKCDKAFSQKSSLDMHERMHVGDKRFVCTICGKRFISKWKLHDHLNSPTLHRNFNIN